MAKSPKRQAREAYQDRLRRERCVHYNGTQNEACRAGVVYKELVGQEAGWGLRLPCIPNDRGVDQVACEAYQAPTQEELEAREAEIVHHLDCMRRGVSTCCEAPLDTSRVITSGRHKGHGPRFCSACKRLCFMV